MCCTPLPTIPVQITLAEIAKNPYPSFMYSNISIPDPPNRTPSTPKSATQAAIEETFSFDGPPDAMIVNSPAAKVPK
jgi:hypothetical protein